MSSPRQELGVLDLQGGVVEHVDHLRRIGVTARRVKTPEHLVGLAGLIIPGGESTCLSRLLGIFGLDTAIRDAFAQGMKIWGTCAGAILLARENSGDVPHLQLIDIGIQRNAFGSQLASFTCAVAVPDVSSEPVPLTFIRAPKIAWVGDNVRVLLRMQDFIAAAESDMVLATVFHPELTAGLAFHKYFARKCGVPFGDANAPNVDAAWTRKSWTQLAPRV